MANKTIEERAKEYIIQTDHSPETALFDSFLGGYQACNEDVVKVIEQERVKNDEVIANSHVYKSAIYMGRNQQLDDILKLLTPPIKDKRR